MRPAQEFVQHVLNQVEDRSLIKGWDRTRPKGPQRLLRPAQQRPILAVIDLKGCLDGENTNKFERPAEADELITWSLCTNSGA